jgi:hypothetical protein
LLGYRLLGNSFGISSGSFLFTNLVLANATNHTRKRYKTLLMKILTLLFSLSLTIGYSQKLYDFDYIMEYDATLLYKKPVKIKNQHYKVSEQSMTRYCLINSQQNEYFAVIFEKDSLNYQLNFDDHKRKVHANAVVLKSDLNDAHLIDMNCRYVLSSINLLKSEDYDFIKLKDTLLNNESFFHYKYSLRNKKKAKRKKIGTYYFIINKSSNFNLPLFTQLNIFEKWILNKKTPIGLIKEKYYIDYYGKLRYTEKLINFIKTDKKIYIPKSCPLTEIIIE